MSIYADAARYLYRILTDVVVPELLGLLQGHLEHFFGARRKGDLHRHEPRPSPDDLLDLDARGLEGDAHGLEDLGGDPRRLAQQAQQELLRADEIVAEAAGLFLSEHDDLVIFVWRHYIESKTKEGGG
jgi:hypothetical protein